MISSSEAFSSSLGRGWRATLMITFLKSAVSDHIERRRGHRALDIDALRARRDFRRQRPRAMRGEPQAQQMALALRLRPVFEFGPGMERHMVAQEEHVALLERNLDR